MPITKFKVVKTGRPRAPRMNSRDYTDLERFIAKIQIEGTCWIWTASLSTRGGYGQFGAHGTNNIAHRWIYQYLVRRLRSTDHLDHFCLRHECVNPDHLEVVTPSENYRRARKLWEAGMRKRWGML